jgi:capsular polysaccharide export protein
MKIAGWGFKNYSSRARTFAKKNNLPYIAIEDGFLRSFGLGSHKFFGLGSHKYPPLSLLMDDMGVYYDATRPSRLEFILNQEDLSDETIRGDARKAISLIIDNELSKYNHAPEIESGRIIENNREKVLVVDQTKGDMSIKMGMADERSFHAMLTAAQSENPDADIYIKMHPEVVAGKKQGHLCRFEGKNTILLRDDVNPVSLLKRMDKVYVVTSQMGFEALLLEKPVSCFGVPFFSGWGITDDHVLQPRRTRKRTVLDIFIAAYIKYSRYSNPLTGMPGTIFDVINHLIKQKKMAKDNKGAFYCFGFSRWKRNHIRSFFQGPQTRLRFAGGLSSVRETISADSRILVWGHNEPEGVTELSSQKKLEIWRVEDGFIRSLGLGSDLIPPMSLVVDTKGIYYDPRQESDLEVILNSYDFTKELCDRANNVRRLITEGRITKYNTEYYKILKVPAMPEGKVLFVPGQVENDASIRYGTQGISKNEELLREVRKLNPGAFIIYKPHPDVMVKNRKGKVPADILQQLCDHVETESNVISCIDAADEVHTLTSLSGFDALLRGKKVFTYGAPFYAGWGLTIDRLSFPRRSRKLQLSELMAGTLLVYPRYFDWHTKSFVECETVINKIILERQRLEATGRLHTLQPGYVKRQAKKLILLLEGWADN